MAKLNPQEILDISTAANAANLGSSEAGTIFRDSLKACYVCDVYLSRMHRSTVEKHVHVPLVFKPAVHAVTDHPVMLALRNLTRQVYERTLKVSHSAVPALVVGAAMREMKLYDSNPSIHFYLHGSEAKDYDRIVLAVLTDMAGNLRRKTDRRDRRIRVVGRTLPNRVLVRYNNVQNMLQDYCELGDKPSRYHTNPIRSEMLIFEDSIYNLSKHDLLSIFEKTGANYGVGYALLPLELAFPDLPANGLYHIYDQADGMLTLTFHGGYANGYTHKKASWKLLLESPVIAQQGCFGFSLVVEIIARLGPFAIFKLIRATNREMIVRPVALPDHMCYVQVLDIMASVDLKTGRRHNDLVYFSVYESEFFELLNYLLCIDVKSMTVETAMTFIRRRGGGASLVAQQLLAPWDLEKTDYYKFALTVWVYAQLIRDKTSLAVKNLDITGVYDKIKRAFAAVTWPMLFWMWDLIELYHWVFSENLTDKLVKSVNPELLQKAWTLRSESREVVFAPVFPREEDDNLPSCPICASLHGKLGQQKVLCAHAETFVDMVMTTEQLSQLANKLIDSDNDPAGLAAVKKRAKDNMPVVGFSHRVRMHHISGGPGTGKSFIIRTLADQRDLVLAPFTKLRSDYTGIDMGDGTTMDYNFKTTHRAMETRGHKRIFLDEYSSFPYEYLMMACKLNGTEEVFIVGDKEQTQVREPDEGLYIGNHVPLDKLGTHTLLVNFRNPIDAICILNENYGYDMEPKPNQEIRVSIEVIEAPELPDIPMRCMGFSAASCALHELDRNTVRANQGGDSDVVALFLNTLDRDLMTNPHLARVALSRHKKKLYLVTDRSERAEQFVASLGLESIDYTKLPCHDVGITKDTITSPEVAGFLDRVCADVDQVLEELHDNAIDNSNFAKKVGSVSSGIFSDDVTLAMASEGIVCASDFSFNIVEDYITSLPGVHGPGTPPLAQEYVSSPVIGEPHGSQEYRDVTTQYVPTPPETVASIEALPIPLQVQPKPIQTGYDALSLLSTLVSNAGQIDTNPSLNHIPSTVVREGFRNGVVDADFITPLTQRHKPAELTSEYRAFCGGTGLHYGAKKPFQTLQVLRDRYVGKKTKYAFTHDAELLARKIVDEFFFEHCKEVPPFDPQEVQQIVDEFVKAAKAKHYAEQFVGLDNTDARVVRFHIKDIYKPKVLGVPDVYKAGQGISAWSKDAQATFGCIMRIMNKRFKDVLKPTAFYDNRETEEMSRVALTSMLETVPATAIIGVSDLVECDSKQNKFTQAIERCVFERLHCPLLALDLYYSFKSQYVIQSSHVRAVADDEKTSGEPATLLGTTGLTMPLNNYIMRGDGPSVIAGKGDDGIKAQCNLHIDEGRLTDIRQYVDLNYKFSLGDTAEFCGNTISGKLIVPSIFRKVNKLVSHRFRSYEHFTEYQKGLRDWVSKVQGDDYYDVLIANAELYHSTIDETRACFEAIQSASHIDEETYLHYFQVIREPMTIMRDDGYVYTDF